MMEENVDQIVSSAHAILAQGESFLRLIDDDDFTRVARPAFSSAIGPHYRHCLDHFTSFLRGTRSDMIDYDARDRNLRLETDRSIALEQTRRIRREINDIDKALLKSPVRIRAKILYAGAAPQEASSTFERELMYVVAHAMHHYALIRVIAIMLEIRLPREFGVAPSTLQHLNRQNSRAIPATEECESA